MFESFDEARMRRWAWLVGLSLYALGAGLDFAHHLTDDLRHGQQAIEYSDLAVAFSAGLFWPIDIIAMTLLAAAR
jgi:hypothetical protein